MRYLVNLIFLLQLSNQSYSVPIKTWDTRFSDTSTFVIIDAGRTWLFDSSYSKTTLSKSDLEIIRKLLIESISNFNTKKLKEWDSLKGTIQYSYYNFDSFQYEIAGLSRIVDFLSNRYIVQLVPALNKFGDKEVFINCFCESESPLLKKHDWHTELIIVKGGGNCFFHFYLNLNSKQFRKFYVNSDE